VKDINTDSQIAVDFMTDGYHKVKVGLPKENLYYFQLWEYADKLFGLIGDTKHKFIKEFGVVKNK
jgi:ribonuclease HI